MILVAGMWLLLAGRLNARRRADQSVSGFVMAMRWTLVSVCWPAVLLGCVIAGVRSRLRDSTLRLVAAGRDAAVITGAQTRRELGKEAHSVKQVPRDHGVPQTAPFWVGQRIHNTYAGLGVVIAVQAKDAADSRGSLPGGRLWKIVVVFDQPYVSRSPSRRVRGRPDLDIQCAGQWSRPVSVGLPGCGPNSPRGTTCSDQMRQAREFN